MHALPRLLFLTWRPKDFDAVVVATGHYTAPYIPDLPGLSAWAEQWPTQVIHSQGYRRPESYAKQVGPSVSPLAVWLTRHCRTL